MNRGVGKSKKKAAAKTTHPVSDKIAAKTAKTTKTPKTPTQPSPPKQQQPNAKRNAKSPPPQKITAVGAPPMVIDLNHNAPLPPAKMERSHSFFLTRKLSKIYANMTNSSKENLAHIPETGGGTTPEPPPFKFTRSLSMATIPIRQSFRRVFRENKLEKLHEENSTEKVDKVVESVPLLSTGIPEVELRKKPLTVTTSNDSSNESRERRTSFIETLRDLSRSIGGRSSEASINSKWSASLASLQQIDTMVSYENLKFIDYDKFNTYEQLLQKKRQATTSNGTRKQIDPVIAQPIDTPKTVERTPPSPPPVLNSNGNPEVRMRKHSIANESDINANFDIPKNLYRQSLDKQKLQFLNRVNRQSFRWSNYSVRNAEDVLILDHVVNPNGDGDDAVDAAVSRQSSIKRRSPNSVNSMRSLSVNDLRMVGEPSLGDLGLMVSKTIY